MDVNILLYSVEKTTMAAIYSANDQNGATMKSHGRGKSYG